MDAETHGGLLVFETVVNCLECQYMHRPNPEEDVFICLRSLELIAHEIDDPIQCGGYEDLKLYWSPMFVEETRSYV